MDCEAIACDRVLRGRRGGCLIWCSVRWRGEGPSRHCRHQRRIGKRVGHIDHANSGLCRQRAERPRHEEPQNVSQVQTAADSWKYYELPKGSLGTLGLCRGGTGQWVSVRAHMTEARLSRRPSRSRRQREHPLHRHPAKLRRRQSACNSAAGRRQNDRLRPRVDPVVTLVTPPPRSGVGRIPRTAGPKALIASRRRAHRAAMSRLRTCEPVVLTAPAPPPLARRPAEQ